MKNVIFDLGGVLIDWNPDRVYTKYFGGDLAKMQRFYQETAIHKINEKTDRDHSYLEALTELSNKLPHYHQPIHLWQTKWLDMIGGTIDDTVKILESLHTQNYPLYALTNFSAEVFFTHVRYNYKFFEYFKDIVVSGVEKAIKPELKIYQILLERNKLDPKQCIFVDDKPENLVPAKNLGMQVIQFTSPKNLKKQLKKLKVMVNISSMSLYAHYRF
ncbi:MAG: HAD family phosphatase [Coxiellaceae bacterium]|jgi:2-haloacid dehalogenase|nr:HAD family phosphatase [Coxiellaceae bacterium]